MNQIDHGVPLTDDDPIRRALDPIERMPARRIPLSTWCVFAATVLFFWAYVVVNKQGAALTTVPEPQELSHQTPADR